MTGSLAFSKLKTCSFDDTLGKTKCSNRTDKMRFRDVFEYKTRSSDTIGNERFKRYPSKGHAVLTTRVLVNSHTT